MIRCRIPTYLQHVHACILSLSGCELVTGCQGQMMGVFLGEKSHSYKVGCWHVDGDWSDRGRARLKDGKMQCDVGGWVDESGFVVPI